MTNTYGAPHSALNRTVADRLFVERSRRGLSQVRMCELLADAGWPAGQTTVSYLENEQRRLTLDHLAVFAAVFALRPAQLLTPPSRAELLAAIR